MKINIFEKENEVNHEMRNLQELGTGITIVIAIGAALLVMGIGIVIGLIF